MEFVHGFLLMFASYLDRGGVLAPFKVRLSGIAHPATAGAVPAGIVVADNMEY